MKRIVSVGLLVAAMTFGAPAATNAVPESAPAMVQQVSQALAPSADAAYPCAPGESFCIRGFRNYNGQWCTGLYSGTTGALLSVWGCG